MPVTNNTLKRFYPTLDTVVNTDDIPDALGFIKDGIETLLEKVHFKDLQYSKSPRGDAAFYSLSIVSKDRIDIEIPGTGIFLILNPDIDGDQNISAFPITISYEWKVLAYLRSFNLDQFDFSPRAFFETALRILSISEEQAIANFINTFTEPIGTNTSLQQFIADLDEDGSLGLLTPTQETKITDVVKDIYAKTGDYATIAAFANYIIHADLNETKTKLKVFFRSLLPQDIEEYIKEILIPKIETSLTLSAGIEFPRNMLQPVYDKDGVNPFNSTDIDEDKALEALPITNTETGAPLAGFTFGEATFYAGTEGFGYEMDIALDSTAPAMIGNTGLILNIRRLKVDLSDTTNIPEADADGRPASFKGVYADEISITLPRKWFNDDDDDSHPATTAKIGAYNMLIGSGGISGTIALEAVTIADGIIREYYEDCFSFQYPIKLTSGGIIETINTYGDLLVYLNAHADYEFVFPLSVKLANGDIEEKDAAQFASLITDCVSTSTGAPARLVKKLGGNGFEIWFTSFDMVFKQGNVVESNIEGGIKIPRLKDANGDIAEIEIKGHIDEGGGFNITASEQDGFAPLKLPNILNLYIQSLEVGRDSREEPFYIGTSCEIEFTNEIINKFLDGQRIKIDHMRIYSDGSFEIGAISVPTTFTINLGPVEITITGINFGSYQEEHDGVMRKYNYFGFDGAISLDPIGVDARGEGIKYYYTTDDGDGKPHHSFISIKTIGVDLTIPGNASASNATAIIKGWLSINEHEYAGGISLKLPKLDIAGGADMRLQPKPPAFIIDAYLDIPIAIPLAATGLGITGFRGLAGFRYVAEKEAVGLHSHDDNWYDYYTYPPNGVHVTKFNGPDKTEKYTNPVSLGAGVTITTMGSSDVISLRVMVLLSIPNMLLIDGRASILSEQWGLDDSGEPPFFAFLIVADNGIEIGAGLDLKIPQDTGDLIDLHVYMQAGYFWDNPSGWYLNMGTREDPITAKVLKLIEMESFLMLSSSGIEAGAKVIFDIDERFGPIRVKAWLKIEVGGFISFERPQIGGHLEVDAGARVDLFGIITVAASFYTFFSAEAAKPFLIYGTARVCGTIKFLFFKKTICATVEFKWERNRQIDTTPIAPIPQSTTQTESQTDMVKGIHMLTGETFNVIGFSGEPSVSDSKFEEAIIPLDTYIDIKFNKGLLPNSDVNSKIGGYNNAPEGYEDLIPPISVSRSGRPLRQVKHQYKITNIEIKASDGGGWQSYDPYKAVDNDATSNLKIGHWQKSSKEYNAIRILGNTPFSYTQQGEPGWFIPEQLGITAASLFCAAQPKEPKCVDFNDKPVGTWLNQGATQESNGFIQFRDLLLATILDLSDIDISVFGLSQMIIVNDTNIFNINQSVQFDNFSDFEILLPNPSVKVNLKLSSNAETVKVTFYKSHLPEGAFLVEYVEIETVNYPLGIVEGLVYETTELISKIVISPNAIDQQRIDEIYEEMAQLFIDTHEYYALHPSEFPSQGITVDTLLNRDRFYVLNTELVNLYHIGCTQIEGGSDSVFCTLHDSLYNVFERCNIRSMRECKNTVKELINQFASDYPREYETVSRELESLLTLFLESIENNLIENFKDLLNFINDKCQESYSSSCNRNPIYCDVYDSLYQVSLNCTSNIRNCKKDVHDIFKLFESQHPNEYTIINNLLVAVSALTNFYNSNEKNIIANLNIILDIIDQEGDCTCQGNTTYTCKTLIHQICWTEKTDEDLNINIPSQAEIEADYLATVNAINKVVEPIWRPNTKYYIHFTLEDEVNGVSTPFNYHYGFKTAGPIGHYHNAPNVVYGNQYNPLPPYELLNRKDDGTLKNPDEFALTSLNNYIDYKRSYPNANGDLLNSKPLFYGGNNNEILLFFIKPYVYHMFKDVWDANNGLSAINNQIQALKIFIKDPVSDLIIPHPMPDDFETTNIPRAVESWENDDTPIMPEHLQFLQNLAAGNEHCVFTGGDPIKPASFSTKVILSNLKPNKLYTAIVTNTFVKTVGSTEPNTLEVHKFVFETSTYKNFTEQVMSFQLKDANDEHKHDAVFNIETPMTSSDISDAFGIVENNTVTNSEFVDPLDSVIEGVFGINPLDPPVTTEFNFIKNENSENKDTIALWIRNPEPFNDPKIPLDIIKDTINILDASNDNDTNYKVLFSKDYSQILFMHSSLKITNTLLKLKFKYLKWNGNAYEVATDLDVIEINQINS